ncbi:unnamed protein product [Effrenium voratum]|nr:unnamed protein product [Effrenium voratum]
MCYPDPHSLAGPNGGLPFRRPVKRSGCSGCSLCSRMPVRHGGTAGSGSESGCYGMAMLQDSAEAVRGVSLPKATRPSPFDTADTMRGCLPCLPLVAPRMRRQAKKTDLNDLNRFL